MDSVVYIPRKEARIFSIFGIYANNVRTKLWFRNKFQSFLKVSYCFCPILATIVKLGPDVM